MVMPALDLTGQQFGFLTVLKRHGSTTTKSVKATWLVRCVCGKEFVAIGINLRNPNRPSARSCGCKRGEGIVKQTGSHGMSRNPDGSPRREYVVWINMRSRCRNSKDKDYPNYGARGIDVCDEWYDSFATFWKDMGETYQSHLFIERVNNNGNYCKDNCRWGTKMRQANNKRVSHYIMTPFGRMTVTQAARRYGLNSNTIFSRIHKGWEEQYLTLPLRSKRPTTC
jgi:hypothetical protein